MFTPSLAENTSMQTTIELMVLPFLAFFSAYMALKEEKPGISDGVILGVYFIIIGVILDLLITVPLFVKSYDFFRQWALWAGYAETIAFSSLAAFYAG